MCQRFNNPFNSIFITLCLVVCCLGFGHGVYAQNTKFTGIVVDSVSGEVLPFVNIIKSNSQVGTATDLNGNFLINADPNTTVKVSFIGYHTKVVSLDPSLGNILIKLAPSIILKNEISIFKNANPAHRIIKLAVKNKSKNNPENITSFTYKSHNKLILNPDISELKKPRDYTKKDEKETERFKEKKLTLVKDSAYYARKKKRRENDSINDNQFAKHLDTTYLFLNETFTERKFKYPNQNNETVLATRTSGFPNLALAAIGTKLQPFGFYADAISLFNKDYINPISSGSTRRYDFTLVQTRINGPGDTTFVINYEPYDDANINGLKGQISINSNGYAIENISATSAEKLRLFEFSIKQMYELIDGKYWFPTQLHSDFIMVGSKVNGAPLMGISRTYLGSIKPEAKLRRMDFIEEELEIPDVAINLPLTEINKLRIDTSSTIKEMNTYKIMDKLIKDSASQALRVVSVLEYLALGAIPIGKVELPLDQFFGVNQFEGFRFGTGIRTNHRLSKNWVHAGYVAYGTKDGRFKYGLSTDYKFSRYFDWHINFAYSFDVLEPGSQHFLNFKNLLSTEGYRSFVTSRMDFVESWRLSTRLRPFKYTGLEFGLDRRSINPGYDYQFSPDNTQDNQLNPFSGFRTLELQGALSLVYGEQYELIMGRRLLLQRGYPAFYLQASRGLQTSYWGDLSYNRLNARIETHFKSIFIGNTFVTLAGGITDRALPYALLFNGMGSKDNNIPVVMRNYFQTVQLYEFTQDQFAALYFYHDFGSLLWKSKHEKFAPKPVLIYAAGWGRLSRPELQQGIALQGMDKGLHEAGLLLRDIYRLKYFNAYYYGLGIASFYRFGPMQLPNQADNWVFKVNLEVSI